MPKKKPSGTLRRHEAIPRVPNDPLDPARGKIELLDRIQDVQWRGRMYWLPFAAGIVMIVYAISLIGAFWLKVTDRIDIAWPVLGTLIASTTGLAFLPRAFRSFTDYLFDDHRQ